MAVTAKNLVYHCSVCGNVVEATMVGGGTLVCCGVDMELMIENSVDASREKHVPIVEKTANGFISLQLQMVILLPFVCFRPFSCFM